MPGEQNKTKGEKVRIRAYRCGGRAEELRGGVGHAVRGRGDAWLPRERRGGRERRGHRPGRHWVDRSRQRQYYAFTGDGTGNEEGRKRGKGKTHLARWWCTPRRHLAARPRSS